MVAVEVLHNICIYRNDPCNSRLRRNVGKDKIVRTKAFKSHEKLATGFGNFKGDNNKNWTLFLGLPLLTQVTLFNRLYYSSSF